MLPVLAHVTGSESGLLAAFLLSGLLLGIALARLVLRARARSERRRSD